MTKYLILLTLLLTGCQFYKADPNPTGSKNVTIVCFGDSLTAGYGANQGHDYPSFLRAKIKNRIINAGYSGDIINGALQRLDSDVLMYNPKIVIITLGVNDFREKTPVKQTLANMMRMIERIKARGAKVVWAEVLLGTLSDPYIKDFRALAVHEHILLIPDVLGNIMDRPELVHDQIHPNDEGYRFMAEKIYQSIKGMIG